MIHIGWPQGILLAFEFIGVCATALLNGKPKNGTHDLGARIFASALVLGLLYWGGFFS
jgi:hypothetical protein